MDGTEFLVRIRRKPLITCQKKQKKLSHPFNNVSVGGFMVGGWFWWFKINSSGKIMKCVTQTQPAKIM